MSKVFRPSSRESKILSRIETEKERARKTSIDEAQNVVEPMSNAISMKLIEEKLLETKSKDDIQAQIEAAIQKLSRLDDFEIDYQVAPFRNLSARPNIVSLYLTAFILEHLINHRSVEEIYGSDEQIYTCIHRQVVRFIPQQA